MSQPHRTLKATGNEIACFSGPVFSVLQAQPASPYAQFCPANEGGGQLISWSLDLSANASLAHWPSDGSVHSCV